jgi:hypothetical protein
MMDKWSLSTDMWTAMKNGIRHYTQNQLKQDPGNMPAEPPPPFRTSFYTPRKKLKVAFRAQSQMGWDNFVKGRMSRDRITCIAHHFQENRSKLRGQECITKRIMGLWDHMDRIWTYRNNRYHENTNQQVATCKTESLDRKYEKIWETHADLIDRLHAFQTKHFEDRQSIGNVNYESKHCWTNIADQYISEAASPIQTEMYTLSKFVGARLGVG